MQNVFQTFLKMNHDRIKLQIRGNHYIESNPITTSSNAPPQPGLGVRSLQKWARQKLVGWHHHESGIWLNNFVQTDWLVGLTNFQKLLWCFRGSFCSPQATVEWFCAHLRVFEAGLLERVPHRFLSNWMGMHLWYRSVLRSRGRVAKCLEIELQDFYRHHSWKFLV